MESQPQNPEFRNNPENFHPCSQHQYMYVNYFQNQSSGLGDKEHTLSLNM